MRRMGTPKNLKTSVRGTLRSVPRRPSAFVPVVAHRRTVNDGLVARPPQLVRPWRVKLCGGATAAIDRGGKGHAHGCLLQHR